MICLLLATLWQATPTPLTLSEAWRSALEHRGMRRVVSAELRAVSAGVEVAGQIPNPTLGASYTGAVPRGHLIADQPLSWLLTRAADQAAAQAVLAHARADSALRMAGWAGAVRRAFYGVVAADRRLELLHRELAVADSLVHIARIRYDAGDISRFEVQQVELESAMQSQQVLIGREQVAVARVALATLMGRTGADLPDLDARLEDGLADRTGPELVGALPAVTMALADSVAADRSAASASRATIPFPSIQAGMEWDDPAEPGRSTAVVGVAIPLPIWNHGGSQLRQARARAEAASARVIEARDSARQELSTAELRLAGAALRAGYARDSLVPAVTLLRERALAAYRAGETGLVPVLEAVRREREIELSAIDAMIAFQDAVASQHELLGIAP